jgi:hypothetical protein
MQSRYPSSFLNGLNPAFSLCLGLALLLSFYLVTLPFFALLVHNDLGWHIATGDLIRATRAIPQVDPWSYTPNGQPWINLAWAWDIVCSLLYEAGGLEYMHLLTFAFGGVCFLLVRQLGIVVGGKPWVASLAALFALVIMPFHGLPDIFFLSPCKCTRLIFTNVNRYKFNNSYQSKMPLFWVSHKNENFPTKMLINENERQILSNNEIILSSYVK